MNKVNSLILVLLFVACSSADVSYENDVAPLFAKYCVGCHNDSDAEGKLSLETFASIQNGGEHGPAVMARDADASRLYQVITGGNDPKMPPEDEPAPNAAEIAVLKQWITEGAQGPNRESPINRKLVTPKIPPSRATSPVTALAISPNGLTTAVARFQSIELLSTEDNSLIAKLDGHAGKINSLVYVNDERLIAASGITGLRGEIVEWNTKTQKPVFRIDGHRDIIYSAIPSHNGKLVASAGYDRNIIIWDRTTKKAVREFSGHNGAIFDLAFSPDGRLLASASADTTIKVWEVSTGRRLDTMSQPLDEQYSVAISPDGQFVYACGADNRIRKWQLISTNAPRINPLRIARFGHEQAVETIRLTRDGQYAVTSSADRTVKIWDSASLTEITSFDNQPDSVQAIALHPNRPNASVGRMDGSLDRISWDATQHESPSTVDANGVVANKPSVVEETERTVEIAEAEPNDTPQSAQSITLPATIEGTLSKTDAEGDVDLFQFNGKAGEEWIVEMNAAKDSPIDSYVAILHDDGRPVLRTRLQAVRDSYFTFRGKDSSGTGDFRVHNWQEMQLNQFLYASGEVVKLYHYPRGPDSGFNVYPNFGSRHGYFDTTPVTHALGSPCYIVEPRAPESTITPNGLPVFPIYFENDDASDRSVGSNSRLTFVVPADGPYVIAASDVRGFHGDKFKYSLIVRRPMPDFDLVIESKNPKVAIGGGKKIALKLKRIDGFDGEVQVHIKNLPEGFAASNPTTFEADHLRAWAVVTAAPDAGSPTTKTASSSTVTATAVVNGKSVTKEYGSLGKIEVAENPKLSLSLAAAKNSPGVLEIEPGTTTTINLSIIRNDHSGPVKFGSEEALINSPHGIYVDNIGLNGVLIPEGQTERTVFITSEPWVQPTERWVFVEAEVGGRPATYPILLRVVPRKGLVGRR